MCKYIYAGHLLHAGLVAGAVFCSFSAVGEWRFGVKRPEFSSFSSSLVLLINIFFSPEPLEDWGDQFELTVFTLLLMFMLSLLVLNFVLAIIIEAYMQVRKRVEDILIEQSFFEDVFALAHVKVLQAWWRWPSSIVLGRELSRYKVKHSVRYKDILKTELFPNHFSIKAFLEYYSHFPFLAPDKLTRYGKPNTSPEEVIAHLVELRIAKLFGIPAIKLKDYTKGGKIAAAKRALARKTNVSFKQRNEHESDGSFRSHTNQNRRGSSYNSADVIMQMSMARSPLRANGDGSPSNSVKNFASISQLGMASTDPPLHATSFSSSPPNGNKAAGSSSRGGGVSAGASPKAIKSLPPLVLSSSSLSLAPLAENEVPSDLRSFVYSLQLCGKISNTHAYTRMHTHTHTHTHTQTGTHTQVQIPGKFGGFVTGQNVLPGALD